MRLWVTKADGDYSVTYVKPKSNNINSIIGIVGIPSVYLCGPSFESFTKIKLNNGETVQIKVEVLKGTKIRWFKK